MRTLALLSCWLLTACSNEPLAKDQASKYVITGKCTPDRLAAAIEDHPDATLIVDFGPNSPNLAETTKAAKRATPPFGISVGYAPKEGTEIADAVIVVDTGATAAIDLALLTCNGIALPANRIEIGTRTITSANRAAGGSQRVAPGDFVLAVLRIEHEEILTTTPDTDVMHSIGIIVCDPNVPWQTAAAAAANATADRYPQVQLIHAASDGNATAPAAQATGLIAQGCRVLLVTTGDPAQTKAIAQIAENGPDGAVPIIVLDPAVQGEHGTCVIGCSANTLGEAAAAIVNQLLPEGGSMIVCFGTDSEGRVQGFCKAMGFATDRLLGR